MASGTPPNAGRTINLKIRPWAAVSKNRRAPKPIPQRLIKLGRRVCEAWGREGHIRSEKYDLGVLDEITTPSAIRQLDPEAVAESLKSPGTRYGHLPGRNGACQNPRKSPDLDRDARSEQQPYTKGLLAAARKSTIDGNRAQERRIGIFLKLLAWVKKRKKKTSRQALAPEVAAFAPKGCDSSVSRAAPFVFRKDLEQNLFRDVQGYYHFKLSATQRLRMRSTAEDGTDAGMTSTDPLNSWDLKHYASASRRAEKNGYERRVLTREGHVMPAVVIAAMEVGLSGGSMGAWSAKKSPRHRASNETINTCLADSVPAGHA